MIDTVTNTDAGASWLSLRLKLTLWMLAITLVLQLTLALILLIYQEKSIGRFFSERAQARVEIIADAVRQADFHVTDDDLRRIAGDSLRFVMSEQFLVTLYTGDGTVVASTIRPPPPAKTMGLDRARLGSPPVNLRQVVGELYEGRPDQPESRLALRRFRSPDGQEFVLALATTDRYYETMTSLTLRVLALSIVIGGVAAGVAGWMIAGLATAPLHELRRIAGSLSPEVIEQKIELPKPSREAAALEKDLQDVRSKLLQALHAQDRFISNASHELKTPIAVLLTEAQTLQSSELTKEARKFVQSVKEEMQRLGRMIESFLTLTKLRGGKALVNARPCGVNDFVMEAVTSCSKMARQYGVTLVPELADSDHPLLVLGDAELLRVMVDNLISNAIRFSPERQSVMIRVTSDETGYAVLVRDSGPGVPEELIGKLFDRFVQASDEAARGRGHGLGLSIDQGIAELHAGRIVVRNLTEGGCEFTVQLPRAQEATGARDSAL